MAVICITGSVSPRLQLIENILLQAGMQSPRPVIKDESIDILQWHRHVLSSIDGESSGAIKDPGRLWELLAGEIVLANLKSPLWGWCDSASIRFLDFWLGFAPEFKFLLVCQTPQQLFAERLENSGIPLKVEELLELWKTEHQEMLRFHHRNPERSILIYASDALEHPGLLVAECNNRWKLSLAPAELETSSSAPSQDVLANFFSYRFSSLHPEIDPLNREIIATATIFAPATVESLTEEPQLEEILAAYLALRQRMAGEEVEFRNESKKLQGEISILREAQAMQQGKDAALQAEKQEENELLLLQLHQVQEELEAVFLKEQELQQELAAARLARDEQASKLSERQAQVEQLTKDCDQLKKGAMEQQPKTLVKERDEQLSRLQSEIKEQQQENELLLLQLHQVQEELEHYFLQYQQIQKQYSAAEGAFRRVLERDPKFYDYEELEITSGNRDDATPSITCRLTNLTAAGRHFPTLAFSVAIEQGCADLIFPDSTEATFLRPPLQSAGQSELVITPQHLNGLADLVTSDWSLVTALIRLLNESFAKPKHLQWSSPLSSNLFLSGLLELERQMESYSARLRFDAVRLKREQVNPDYEHLWFEFDNLSFSGEIWPSFEFRLSCAHVRPDYFGGFPKLEFPAEGSQAPFEGWFVEASDDFGDKLELRFSLPDNSMDLGVWERVTGHDRDFMRALAAGLPFILSTLQQSGVQIARSWEDWSKMVTEMQSVMTPSAVAITAASGTGQEQKGASVAGLRYDRVSLKREQVNPDYEHLWFELGNLSFSGKAWPHFEFRLSCAHVRPDYFGGFPKLEFPAEGSQAPFEGWFIEAADDFGDKLEVRFSLPDKSLDLAVWERVTVHDRNFIKALIAELPQLLSSLRQSGAKIRRPWEDWTKMAVEMMPIVINSAKAKGKKKSSFKKLLRRLNLAEK